MLVMHMQKNNVVTKFALVGWWWTMQAVVFEPVKVV